MRSILAALALWTAQSAPAPVAVPDNPCELLTVEQVAQASGVKVTSAKRVRSRGEDQQTPPPPGSICHYETAGEYGSISIAMQRPPVATPATFRASREQYFAMFPGRGRAVRGVGQDAWVGNGMIRVLVRDDLQCWVITQDGDAVGVQIAVAKAIVRRFGS